MGCSLSHSSLTSPSLLTLSATCSYHLSFFSRWYFSHNFQRATFAILSCLCLYSLWANFSVTLTDNMVYTLAFSPHYLHKGDSRGIVDMVSVTWLVLRACSWPAQISASVWIFESAFRNQLKVFLHVLFRVFLIKLTMQIFPSNCRVSAHCSKMSSINWTDSFLPLKIP